MDKIQFPIMIGIDPGFDRMGWGVGQQNSKGEVVIIAHGCILTPKSDDIFVRYKQLRLELETILHKYAPAEAGIETLFFSNNQKTAMRVSEARGIIISVLLAQGCQVAEYNPLQIKQAVTGFGKAEKAAVDKMVRLQLKLPAGKIIDDTMDALAVLLTHSTARKINKLL
jgi:crossover junction endodeoxyribonuclease RuvC